MAQIPRPPKQGSVTTYVAKVAAGYPRILAGEMDADLDTIYGAWNGGVDTVNIRDGSVTSDKLAADAVGPREIADGGVFTVALADGAVTTPKLADGNVTDPKIVSVAWSKVTGAPAAAWGVAGGDLSGSYPTPSIRDGAVTPAKLAPGAVTGDALAPNSVGAAQIVDGSIGTADLAPGAVDTPQLALDAATQFGGYSELWAGAGTIPLHITTTTELLLSVQSAAPASRGGFIVVMGLFSGVCVAGAVPVSITGRVRIGGTATGVDGTVFGVSRALGNPGAGSAPFQLVTIAWSRGAAGASGPFKLTVQLTDPGAVDIHAIQLAAWEFA